MTKEVEKNYGKLYDPTAANTFVWHVVPKNYKAGTAASFVGTRTADPTNLINQGFTLVSPVQMGRYDEHGYYHTYKPPVEGCFPGKYIQVLQGQAAIDAKNQYERRKIYERYPAKEGMEVSV